MNILWREWDQPLRMASALHFSPSTAVMRGRANILKQAEYDFCRDFGNIMGSSLNWTLFVAFENRFFPDAHNQESQMR